jgi:hypothetical protein
LHQIAKLSDNVCYGTGFVDIFGFDFRPSEANLIEWRGRFAGIECLDDDFRAVATRNSERRRRRPGEKRNDAQLDRRRRCCGLLRVSRHR